MNSTHLLSNSIEESRWLSADPFPRHCELKITIVIVEVVAVATHTRDNRAKPLVATTIPGETNK